MGGVNKALLEVGGKPVIDRILDAIASRADEVVLVANDTSLDHLRLPTVLDAEPHAGVLPALLTGLEASSAELCLVLACDMPFVQPALIDHLFEKLGPCEVAIPHVEGQFQPMHAVYQRQRCSAAIRDALARGDRRMISFLDEVRSCSVDEASLRPLDSELLSFFNINTPDDLERAQTIAERLKSGPGPEMN